MIGRPGTFGRGRLADLVGIAVLGVLGLGLGACSDDDEAEDADDRAGSSSEVLDDDEVEEILDELLANGFCDPSDVDDLGPVTAMHFVVQGSIRPPCHLGDGDTVSDDGDARLLEAWRALTDITPDDFLRDISLLAGYECASCDTLAFVSALDEEGSFFLLAVDMVAATDDPDELLVTLQHELSHVFTQIPGEQLDVGDDDGTCPTFHNGTGCFVEGSYLAEWIDAFWSDDLLDELPPDGEPSSDEEADERCVVDASFAGPYAATSPEEDFAETFAAYVFDIDVPDALDDKLEFLDARPEFVEVRQNAAAAGLAGLDYEFETCG